MTVKFLLNPYSNRWNARKRWPETEAALKAAGAGFQLDVSEQAGSLELRAAKAVTDGVLFERWPSDLNYSVFPATVPVLP